MKSQIDTAESAEPRPAAREFAFRFSSTPRGARLARRLTAGRLAGWGVPEDGELSGAAVAVVGELAANAVTHGCVPGREFELVLRLTGGVGAGRCLRIEVSDAHPGAVGGTPGGPEDPSPPDRLATGGRGLRIVGALADRWGCGPRRPGPAPRKTVWAELDGRG